MQTILSPATTMLSEHGKAYCRHYGKCRYRGANQGESKCGGEAEASEAAEAAPEAEGRGSPRHKKETFGLFNAGAGSAPPFYLPPKAADITNYERIR